MNLKDLTTKLVCVSFNLFWGHGSVFYSGVCVCMYSRVCIVTKVGICLISLNSSATMYSEIVLICSHQHTNYWLSSSYDGLGCNCVASPD